MIDNHTTHKAPKIKAWLARKPLQCGVHRSTAELEADIAAFMKARNENPKPYKWGKSAGEILASVKRFCQKQLAELRIRVTWICRQEKISHEYLCSTFYL